MSSKPAHTQLSIFMEEEVYPRLYDRLDEVFPEFGFVERGDKYEATLWPSDFPIAVDDPRPDRLMCYSDAPWMIYIHGRGVISLVQYVNKGNSVTGAAFPEICRYLAGKVGVQFPEHEVSEEEREQARRWEERKIMLRLMIKGCQAYLFSPSGAAARDYMTLTRGFTEDDLKTLGIGLLSRIAKQER